MAGESSADDPFGLCGQTIEGKYRVAAVVGDGGFGVVYRAIHKGFDELIAVKCLKMPAALGAAERDALLETLRDEGRILHRLSRATSSIVQALDVGAFTTDAGVWVPYLIMEWLEGETLAQFLRARAGRGEAGMPIAEAVRLLDPAARALAIAHAQKVAHRDVKPANLFLTEVGATRTLKVLDFGIAKVLANHPTFTEALAATRAAPSAFTPRYGAPEQFNKARGATGPWTDVFALALIFIEIVSGKKALEGDDPTQLYIASADPSLRPTLRARGAEAPAAVERVLDKALAIEPKHRYPSAGDFWEALVAAARGEAGAAARGDARGETTAGAAAHGDAARDAALDTAAFAAAKQLEVATGASRLRNAKEGDAKEGDAAGGDATEAAGSHAPAPERPAVVRVSQRGAPQGPGGAGSAGPAPREDSMLETAAPQQAGAAARSPQQTGAAARSPQQAGAAARSPQQAGPDAAHPRPPAPDADARPRRSGARAALPWVLGALLVGGGAAAYLVSRPEPAKPPRAPATSASRASPRGERGAPSASAAPREAPSAGLPAASASAAASAPAGPPTPPPDMAYVAPVKATIGAGPELREVTLTRGFFIDRDEVTVRAYRACITQRKCSAADHVALKAQQAPGAQPAEAPPPPTPTIDGESDVDTLSRRCNEPRGALDHPINCVDYANAEGYCRFRGRRLPTEAEWEIAARGAEGRQFAWGPEAPVCERACYDRNEGCLQRGVDVATCAIGSHPGDRTPDGIYDLAGNVSEWVSDGYVYPPPGGVDPQGDPSIQVKVVRGAGFLDPPDELVATHRTVAAAVTAHVSIGFRCAMDVPAPGQEAPPADAPRAP